VRNSAIGQDDVGLPFHRIARRMNDRLGSHPTQPTQRE
jgi:hypothetical protein